MNYRTKPQLQKLVSLFLEKNKSINLSAIRDEEGMWEKHIEDSLEILPLFEEFTDKKLKILDLGTGGGFPGLPLAIMLPQHHFTLLDATRKKIDCVKEFAEALELTNVTPQWGRAEDGSQKFDLVVTRATSYIDDLFVWIVPLLKSDGRAWLYKQASEEEWNDGQKIAKKL